MNEENYSKLKAIINDSEYKEITTKTVGELVDVFTNKAAMLYRLKCDPDINFRRVTKKSCRYKPSAFMLTTPTEKYKNIGAEKQFSFPSDKEHIVIQKLKETIPFVSEKQFVEDFYTAAVILEKLYLSSDGNWNKLTAAIKYFFNFTNKPFEEYIKILCKAKLIAVADKKYIISIGEEPIKEASLDNLKFLNERIMSCINELAYLYNAQNKLIYELLQKTDSQ